MYIIDTIYHQYGICNVFVVKEKENSNDIMNKILIEIALFMYTGKMYSIFMNFM